MVTHPVSRQFLDRQFLDWVTVRVRVRVAVQELTVQELSGSPLIQIAVWRRIGKVRRSRPAF